MFETTEIIFSHNFCSTSGKSDDDDYGNNFDDEEDDGDSGENSPPNKRVQRVSLPDYHRLPLMQHMSVCFSLVGGALPLSEEEGLEYQVAMVGAALDGNVTQ